MAWNRNQRRIAEVATDCYRVYDAENNLLYVGASVNVFRRMRQHRDESWWYPQATRVIAREYVNRRDARYAEALAIRDERPIANVTQEWSEIAVGRGRELPVHRQMLELFLEPDGNWWHYGAQEVQA